ncbi:MAG: DUF296 domain-containing protein [Desulfobacterales bacterium]|jgi:predicted DNA-binding protein with PD1-like motif
MGTWQAYQPGRRLVGRLTNDEDLIEAITTLGVQEQVPAAVVTLTGRITLATIGAFDARQQVYVTRREERPMEIIACRGLLTTGEPRPFLHAHIVLADENTVIGGRLFSDTLAAEAECVIEELRGPAAARDYDARTGQLVLAFGQIEAKKVGS